MRYKGLVFIVVLFVALAFIGVQAAPKSKAEKKEGISLPGIHEYAGSATCKSCHALEYESWNKSLTSKMVRSKADGILKDAVAKWKTDGQNPGPTQGNITGRTVTLDDVEYVIGSHWKQRYIVKNEVSGGHQFLNKQFNAVSGKWENYGNKNDWTTMCATCHTTGLKVEKYDPADPKTTKISYTEMNIGCEACHGPAAKHAKTASAKDVWNPSKQPKDVQTRQCGYCHIRLENEKYKSLQGNNSEHFPAPKLGETAKPWDNWTVWYPEGVVIPGVQPNQPYDKAYTQGDFKGIFLVDDISKKNGVYEEGKHHEQYQGFIQSSHYKKNILSCNDCHSSHAVPGKDVVAAKEKCAKCHGNLYSYDKIMPGTGKTAEGLYVRTHTFIKNQSRQDMGKTAPHGYTPEVGLK